MKKILLTTLIGSALHYGAFAQVTHYTFATIAGQYTDLANVPGAVIRTHNIQDDIVAPEKLKLPFTFTLGNEVMDSLGISENGYLFFGNITSQELSAFWPISAQQSPRVKGIISPLGIDLVPVDIPGRSTTLKTAVAGTAPNRVFITEWKETSRLDAFNDVAGPDRISFQVKLYETSNKIEFSYGVFALNPNVSEDIEVGLKGATYGDYHNRMTTSANWGTSSRGTSQTSRQRISAGNKPAVGTTFVWNKQTAPTPVEKVNLLQGWSIYPIPATNKLNIKTGQEAAGAFAYTISDASGRSVLSGQCGNGTIDIGKLAPGQYVIRILHNGMSAGRIISKQ